MAAKKSARASLNVPPYGAPVNDAIKRGDRAEMRRLLSASKKTLKDSAKLQAAVDRLEAELGKD